MIRFRCSNCEAKMEVDESFAGRAARCPTCGHELRIPKAGETPTAGKTPRRPGAAVVDVDGEKVEVVPPIEATAKISVGLVGLSVIAWAIGTFSPLSPNPWAFGGFLGVLVAAAGAIMSLPAYQSIKQSRGAKRGKQLATAGLLGGAGLFVVYAFLATYGLVTNVTRPPCEENIVHICAAMNKYAAAHDGTIPGELKVLVAENLLDSKYISCPAYKEVRVGTQTYQVVPSFNINNAMFPGELLVLSDGPPYNLHDDGDDVCLVRVLLLKDVRKGEIEVKDLKDRDHLILSANWAAYQRGQQDHWNEIMTRIKNVQGRAATPAATGTAAAPTSTAPAAPTSTAPAAPTATAPATPTSTAPAAAATTAPAPTPATSEPAPAKDSGSLMPSPTTAPINPVPTPVVPAPSPTDSAPVTVTPSATPAASKGDAK